MKEMAKTYLNLTFRAGLLIVVLSSLFLFANLTTEFYETPKFIVLLAFVGITLVLLTLKFTLDNRINFTRTPLDLPLLLLVVVGAVSTILSPAPYISLLGNQLKVSSGLVALIAYVLFYFIVTNNLKSLKEVKTYVNLGLGSGVLLSIISLLAFFGLTLLPKPWSHGLNFTPTGSSFSTTAVLILFLPLVISAIFSATNITSKTIHALILALFGVTIVLTGSIPLYVAAAFAAVVAIWVNSKKLNFDNMLKDYNLLTLGLAIIVVAIVALLSFVPVPGASNPFLTQSKNFPREVQLSFVDSWKIAVSSFRDSPFWGTGPSTFLFNFTTYKPVDFNQTKFWNIRFDSAFNEYLQVLSTLGGIGLLALLSLTALFISSAFPALSRNHSGGLKQGLAISGLAFFAILALHTSSLVVWVIGLLVLAAFFAVNRLDNPGPDFGGFVAHQISRVMPRGSMNSISGVMRIEALPSILLTISVALVLYTFFFAGKFILADYHHRLALNAVAQNNGILTYNELVAAEKLNGINDVYRTDLAQTNFALANAIASAKGPTEAAPNGTLTDQDKQNIQVLLQQSINEGRTSVTLNPRSAINWEILALLYRQIAGVAQNALLFSLDSYGRAIFNDPLNPNLRLNVGGTYYAVQNYDLAIRFFSDAINLKPDFANGYYNLSVALRDKGDLPSALQAAEKVVSLITDKSSSDYKIATDYLTDLKNKAGVPAEPPAATTSGELQNDKLPKVIDLPKPDKIATPEAIKKPNSTPAPQP